MSCDDESKCPEVPSNPIVAQETDCLKRAVAAELNIKDPSIEKASALLKERKDDQEEKA